MIHAIILICPECRRLVVENPPLSGMYELKKQVCMRCSHIVRTFFLDDELVEKFMEGYL